MLLVRNDGIGDALACAPLVAALRDAGHTLGAVLGPCNAGVFARGAFAYVHVLERIPWPAHGSTPQSRRVALGEVRAVGYDVALIASEELDAYRFARDAGIGVRVGFINGWEKPLKGLHVRALLTRSLVREASAQRARGHEAQIVFALGAGLHDEARPTRDVARLRRVLLDGPVARDERVLLQVSRKYADHGLNVAAYSALARELAGRAVRVFAAGDDPALVEEVAATAGIAGEHGLDLAAWKARIAAAPAVVTPDSGAAHVAGCLGVPCVDCFAPQRATARDIVRWHPWAAPFRAHVLDPTRTADALAAQLTAHVLALLSGRRADSLRAVGSGAAGVASVRR
ncbi:MAG: hypothetical protein M3R44_02860 [Candidatus Eremiobacteraeota bacterium]|nr:hypothetical protein [Candidatus Eremiobacteraeota bacterium]